MLMVRLRQFAEPLQGKTQAGRKSSWRNQKNEGGLRPNFATRACWAVHALLGDKRIDAGAGESCQIHLFEMVKCASSLAPVACA
jgi:hypothetical protein